MKDIKNGSSITKIHILVIKINYLALKCESQHKKPCITTSRVFQTPALLLTWQVEMLENHQEKIE